MDLTPTDLFLRDCGVDGPVGLDVEDVNQGDSARKFFPRPFAVIGRDPASDLPLDHWQVSRRHVYLQWIGGRPLAVDLESRTGTNWGPDAPPRDVGWLGPGREIRLGPVRIQAPDPGEGPGAGEPPKTLPTRRYRGAPDRPELVLESPDAGGRWSSWRMDRILALAGRSPRCKIHLGEDTEVSRFQCALLRLPTGLWAVDLLGRGGIHVEGTRVRFARVGDGDEIRLGRFVIRVRYETPPAPSPGEELRVLAPWTSSSWALAIPEGRRDVPTVVSAPRPVAPVFIENSGGVPLGPILDQIGQMQQQMLEQFHQAMLAMFQAFGTIHRDQMAGIREELDQIRRLTEDLQAAKSEAEALPRPRREGGPGSVTTPPDPGRPAETPEPPNPRKEQAGPTPPLRKGPRPRADAGADNSDAGLHAELSRRIAQLQNDRQSRWQKILDLVGRSNPNSD